MKITAMAQIKRQLSKKLNLALERGKSILLLGPRHVGKTTLLKQLTCDLYLSLVEPSTRLRYEQDPKLLSKELEAIPSRKKTPLIIIDEVQKIPRILDAVQYLIDEKKLSLF